MLERYHNIGGHLRLDPEGTLTSYADAQATIADLQRQVTKWQEIASLRFAGDHKFVKEMESLKADHARVLGALRNCHITARRALASKTADLSRMVLMFEHIKRYCEEAGIEQGGVLRAASLPAQPAQGIIDRMAHINDGCECRICKPQPAQGGVES